MEVVWVVVAVVVLVVVVTGVAVPLLIRRLASSVERNAMSLALGQNGADTVQQHAGELAAIEGVANRVGVHLDLADDLGTKVAGSGMSQPTQGTLHVVGRSAPDARAMRAPCTIAYAIESLGVPAFSGEQVFEVDSARWPEPGVTLPCVYDAANPSHVDIEWQQVPSSGDKALGDARALAEELNRGDSSAG